MASNSILANMAVALTANVSDFQRGMATAKKELAGFKKAGEQMQSFGEGMSKYITAPLAGISAVALKTFGDIEALKKGLFAVAGSAEEADKQFASLKEVAKLPGLGLEEAIQGSINLQAAGFSAEQAEGALKGFGNALATVGKGKAELEGVSTALSQMAAKGKISAEEINQIAERVPQIRKVMQQAFGTSNTEELQKMGISATEFVEKVNKELSKLPPVAGGLKNSFENLADSGKLAFANLGESISKNLNIEGLLNGIAEKLGGLAEAFSNLSPTTQRFIVIGSALAAAIGPILLGVGALAAAIPTLAAGFAILTGPIGLAVAAFVALSIAAVKTISSIKSQNKSFEDQKKHVANLDKSFIPLVNRYDELKAKSSLSKDEQTELNSIIAQIAKTAPDAITQFDKYGKALDISSAAARKFVETQRAIAGIKNKEKIQEQVAEFKKLDKELEKLQAKFAKGVQVEYKQVETARGVSSEKTERALTNTEKQELGFQIKAIQDKQNALRAYVRELNGMPPLLATIGNASADAAGKITGLTKEQQKALDEMNAALKLANKEFQVHGDVLQYTKDKAGILEGGWKSLLKEGLNPQSATIQKVKGDWQQLTKALSDYEKRISQAEMPKLNPVTSLQYAPVPLQLKLLPVTPEEFKVVTDSLIQPILDFAATMSAAVNDLLVGSFVSLGEAIGTAFSGGTGSMDSFFNAVLMSIMDFAAMMGKQLIVLGAGKIALDKLFESVGGGPLAIAAGIALVAAAGAAKTALSKGVGNIATPSAPRSASPNYGSGYDGPGGGAFGQVVFEIQGDKLRGVLDRANYRNQRLGG